MVAARHLEHAAGHLIFIFRFFCYFHVKYSMKIWHLIKFHFLPSLVHTRVGHVLIYIPS
jgi:hypothetical protein